MSLLVGGNNAPTLAVARTGDTVTVELTFRGLDPGQVATVTADGQVVAVAAFGPSPDGTAIRSVTAAELPTGAVVAVNAQGGRSICTATLRPGVAVQATCPGS